MVKVTAPSWVLSILTCIANKVIKQLPNQKKSCMQRSWPCCKLLFWCIRLRTDLQNHSSNSDIRFPFETAQYKSWWWSTRLAGLAAFQSNFLWYNLQQRRHLFSICCAGLGYAHMHDLQVAAQEHRVSQITPRIRLVSVPSGLSPEKNSYIPSPATPGTREQNLINVLIYFSLLKSWKRRIIFMLFFLHIWNLIRIILTKQRVISK